MSRISKVGEHHLHLRPTWRNPTSASEVDCPKLGNSSEQRGPLLAPLGCMETPKKCGHPSCHCNSVKDSDYCSTYCEGGAKTADIVCSCGHPGCAVPESNR